MGFADQFKDIADKAKDLAGKNKDAVDKAVDKVGGVLDERTGGKFSGVIDSGKHAARGFLGADEPAANPTAEEHPEQ
jgi:hypothetical protein